MVTNDEKQEFSNRLNKVLDRAGAPPKGKNRQGKVAKMFGVSQKGARKWLEGEAIPKSTRIPQFIAEFKEQQVTGEWLFYGNPDYAPHWDKINDQSRENQIAALMPISTSGSIEILEKLKKACMEGRLTEDDMELLDAIAERLTNDTGRKDS